MKTFLILLLSLIFLQGCRKNEEYVPTEFIPALVNQEFRITSPKEGDLWLINQTYEIRWIPSSKAERVNLELYRKNTLKKVIANQIQNRGHFLYQVPSDLESSNLYKIKIYNSSSPEEFVWSSYFSIR